MYRSVIAGVVVLGACLAGGIAAHGEPQAPQPGLSAPQTQPSPSGKASAKLDVPDFTLIDHKGRQVTLSDHAGKIIVLEWINPDCPYVQRHYEEKTMQSLADKYKGKNVVWLAINTTATADQKSNQGWAEKNNLPYPILDDSAGRVARLYGAKTTPHMFIIDRSGKLIYKGAIDDDPRGNKEDAVNYVDQVLAKLTSGESVTLQETKPYGCSVKFASK